MAGDAAACHVFLKESSVLLRGFLRVRLTGLPDEVEDLVQETLPGVHRGLKALAACEERRMVGKPVLDTIRR